MLVAGGSYQPPATSNHEKDYNTCVADAIAEMIALWRVAALITFVVGTLVP
jgi:hypothetical protein